MTRTILKIALVLTARQPIAAQDEALFIPPDEYRSEQPSTPVRVTRPRH